MISAYESATFFRGISSGRALKEIDSLVSTPKTFLEMDLFVNEQLSRRDFIFDPMTPSSRRVKDEDYLTIRSDLLAQLEGLGIFSKNDSFASLKLNQSQQRLFDKILSQTLYLRLEMTLYEANREEIWSYLTARVLPDLALIRFNFGEISSRQTKDRFSGVDRNVFRRLFHRITLLKGDFKVLENLQEDNLVAVFERPRLTRDEESVELILKAIIEHIIPNAPKGKVEDCVRDFAKRVLRMAASLRFEFLETQDATQLLREIAESSVSALKSSPQPKS